VELPYPVARLALAMCAESVAYALSPRCCKAAACRRTPYQCRAVRRLGGDGENVIVALSAEPQRLEARNQ
jgi:hypothetical protein